MTETATRSLPLKRATSDSRDPCAALIKYEKLTENSKGKVSQLINDFHGATSVGFSGEEKIRQQVKEKFFMAM
jgi:hypothetical protein